MYFSTKFMILKYFVKHLQIAKFPQVHSNIQYMAAKLVDLAQNNCCYINTNYFN